MRQSSRCCLSEQFGLLAAQFPLGAGDGHALAGAHADEIGFELGEGGEDIEEHLSHGIARVVEGPAYGPASRLVPEADRRWNTAHIGEAVRQRKHAGLTVEPELLAHISPLGWAHIPAHLRIPVAKAPIAALAYDSAPYRSRPQGVANEV